ncbi:arginine N-succinyltransferase [Silvimonas iriomotensis]|uniref:Arginine N-succinyltransferase subunit beta n=1 Tax=Silvimonas iriomotensis TaxID=449662 RepID=A0ABQ2P640_9NEIS|nr:arginine N-succinyltransferase [Silvimonas iriomotensis]GGP19098.1 arginine N-succinyltransferase subunit beta [Silvimonas iriomotensis]
MRIRFLRHSDFHRLFDLANKAGVGVTTLQPNAERLQSRIAASMAAVAGEPRLGDASYFFALEDETTGQLVGTSGIESAVGMRDTWYNYRVGLTVHTSRELDIYKQLTTLFLSSDLTGSSELCSLFLLPEHRGNGNGGLLSKSRFLFMAEFPHRFAERVIAEMRGVSDDAGRSPFWESLGRHFFKMDFARADFLSYVGNKSFIAELMPSYPIYTCLLSEEAQAAVAEVHPATRPARKLLETEGFRYRGYVDIFDAGPSLESALHDIRAVRDSQVYKALAVKAQPQEGESWLVSNRKLQDFRCVLAMTHPLDGALPLTDDVLQRLEIADGDSVRAVRLAP